jgi:hypothetical protein
MTKEEMRSILSEQLAKYRAWSYDELAARIVAGHMAHDEGIATDGTSFQLEFDVFWDDKPHGDVRVCGDLSAEPRKRFLGVLLIYVPDVTDSFIKAPNGRFVGESGMPIA